MMRMFIRYISGILPVTIVIMVFITTACGPHYYYLQPVAPRLTTESIIELSRGGTADTEIIRMINESATVIYLRTDDIIRLHESGVSTAVIDHLITVREWALLARPGVSLDESSSGKETGTLRISREGRQSRSLVPVSIH